MGAQSHLQALARCVLQGTLLQVQADSGGLSRVSGRAFPKLLPQAKLMPFKSVLCALQVRALCRWGALVAGTVLLGHPVLGHARVVVAAHEALRHSRGLVLLLHAHKNCCERNACACVCRQGAAQEGSADSC